MLNGKVKTMSLIKLEIITSARYRLLVDLIKTAQEKKLIFDEDVDDLASLIMGAVRMIIFQWKLKDYQFSLTQRGKSVIDTMLKMLIVKK